MQILLQVYNAPIFVYLGLGPALGLRRYGDRILLRYFG